MNKCHICLISTVQTSFWGSQERQFENYYVPAMQKAAAEMDFDLTCISDVITCPAQARQAKSRILEGNYDFLLIQVSTFADGNIIVPLAETGIRLGLWAIPEITANGPIPNNSFCGINMYGSILHQYVDPSLPFKWFYGDVADPLLKDRLNVTVRAISALKGLEGARVGLIGGIANGFNDLYYDERLTKSRLGVTVDRFREFGDVREKAMSYPQDQIRPIIEAIRSESACIASDMTSMGLENTARAYKAFEDIVKEEDYDAIAISCWPRFRKEMGIVVCSVIGRLLQKGIVAACEGDVDSAISMLLLRNLTGQQPMLMDLSKLDFEANAALMWHCGSAPGRYADKQGVLLDGHYKPGSRVTCMDNIRVSGVNNMYYAQQAVTIARFTEEYRNMFLLTGEFFEREDRSFDGSRGWLGNLKLNGEPISLKDLVNTIMVQGYQHHYPIVAGNIEPLVQEVMAWLSVKPLRPVPYQDYLQLPDRRER